ncbi:hypothetical protein CIW49_24365 [Mycolicibacterium sp. P1-18]|uniref:DUF7155 family protein n=1 Tax=Mycolicibacterium sp. P1-18 TaxID=2024615 RepID=UPI0011F3653A|nr:hypothetical protein [Mycolicibacterium sp. P1-18]KAA0094693.1 hypothetical protein CIW49_24365 [Mycolicibacterium sp. P1-18]
MTISARRIVSAGALAVATVAAPLAIGAGQAVAAPCLATVTTNGSDPVCVGYSNGNPTNIGTPNFGTFGPNNGLGVSTGNLAPGQTWRQPIA